MFGITYLPFWELELELAEFPNDTVCQAGDLSDSDHDIDSPEGSSWVSHPRSVVPSLLTLQPPESYWTCPDLSGPSQPTRRLPAWPPVFSSPLD